MPKYEFTFVVTDVELSEEQRDKVDRAVVLAGTAALGSALPTDAVSAPLISDEFIRRHWCGGIPPADLRVPSEVLSRLTAGS
jgi:hypothetical protein